MENNYHEIIDYCIKNNTYGEGEKYIPRLWWKLSNTQNQLTAQYLITTYYSKFIENNRNDAMKLALVADDTPMIKKRRF